jgi:hypothetical protein
LDQTFYPKKTKTQIQTITLNPPTKKDNIPKPKPKNPKIQKMLDFKNNLLLLRYFNEYIFSDFFLNPNIFGFFGFGLGLELGFFGFWVWTQTQI